METKEYPKPVTLSAANRALSAALRERDSLLSVNKQLLEALEIAEIALEDLGACQESDCSEPNCSKPLSTVRTVIQAAKASS